MILIGTTLLQLIYEKLPADIASRHVLLLDPVLATGLIQANIYKFFRMCNLTTNIFPIRNFRG